jgi:hypothetical protein
VHQLGSVLEPHLRPLEPAAPLDPDRVRPVHHHLVDGRVGEQWLERPEPRRQQQHPLAQLPPLRLRQRRRLALDQRPHVLRQRPRRDAAALARAGDQPLAQRRGELLEAVHAP